VGHEYGPAERVYPRRVCGAGAGADVLAGGEVREGMESDES